MLTLVGWAQFSGWKLTWTGETGGWRMRGKSVVSVWTGGSVFGSSAQLLDSGDMLCSGRALRSSGLDGGEAAWGAELVTVAIVRKIKV